MVAKKTTKQYLRIGQIKPKHSIGQILLIDNNIIRKIVRKLREKKVKVDWIIEVGAGPGNLTYYLWELEPHKGIITLEKDTKMVHLLNERFGYRDDIFILKMDLMRFDYRKVVDNYTAFIIGNIPYYLTTDLLVKKVFPLSFSSNFKGAGFMLQKEVALRIMANPGEKLYSKLTVIARIFTFPELITDVSPTCFYPVPKVESSFMLFTPKNFTSSLYYDSISRFMKFLSIAFSKRRKKISNIFKDHREFLSFLEDHNISIQKRPDEITIEEYELIINYFCSQRNFSTPLNFE